MKYYAVWQYISFVCMPLAVISQQEYDALSVVLYIGLDTLDPISLTIYDEISRCASIRMSRLELLAIACYYQMKKKSLFLSLALMTTTFF